MSTELGKPALALSTAASRSLGLRSAAAWVPGLFGLLVICCESTRVMGADHTMIWLSRFCSPLMQLPVVDMITLNHVLRKSGHFFGYGILGLILLQGWLSVLQGRLHQTWAKLRLSSGGFALLSVAFIASMDELHQSFLPNRTACVSDVFLDTAGALLLISLASLVLMLRRRRLLSRLLHLRSLRQWQSKTWAFRDTLLQQVRS